MKNPGIPNRLIYWAIIYLYGLLFFAFFRTAFYIYYADNWTMSEILNIFQSYLIGLRYDTVIILVALSPLILFTMLPIIKFGSRRLFKVITLILSIFFSIIAFMWMADLNFFKEFASHLNYWAIEYIEYPAVFLHSVIIMPIFWIAIIALIVMSIYNRKLLTSFSNRFLDRKSKIKWPIRILAYIVTIVIIGIGIRGGLGIKKLDWGAAYFCDNQFINQASLNPVFTLSNSIYEELRDGKTLFGSKEIKHQYYNLDEANEVVYNMLKCNKKISNTKLNLTDSLSYAPNLIFILMESWSANKIGVLGNADKVSPNFDRFAGEGILFTNFYANGIRTNRGIPAIFCSFPSLPGRSIMKRYAADHPFVSIAEIMDQLGGRSIFAYGGDIEFDNMHGFLKAVGYDDFLDEAKLGKEYGTGKWGIPDHKTFELLAGRLDKFPRPFNLSALTISYHEPYVLPDESYRIFNDSIPKADLLNQFYYSDASLAVFIDSLKKLPVYDSTIVIITADHSSHQSAQHVVSPRQYHIPLLIMGGAIKSYNGMTVDKIGSQVDIIPTLLELANIKTDYKGWGRNLFGLEENDPGFAVLTLDDRMALLQGNYLLTKITDDIIQLYDLNDPDYLKNDLSDSLVVIVDSMLYRLNAYLQTSYYLSQGHKLK